MLLTEDPYLILVCESVCLCVGVCVCGCFGVVSSETNLHGRHLTFHLSLCAHTQAQTHTQRASLLDEGWSGEWSAEDIKWSVCVCV